MIEVVIVEDQTLVRDGIAQELAIFSELKVIAKLPRGEAAVAFAKKQTFDVMLMDLNMPGIGGIEAIRKILARNPRLGIIILSQHTEPPFPEHCLGMGAMGYLSKDCQAREVFQAIQCVANGTKYIANKIAKRLALQNILAPSQMPLDRLSRREFQIMMHVVKGEPIKDIAKTFCISPKTINSMRTRIFEKLNVANNVELTHFAIRSGLLRLETLNPNESLHLVHAPEEAPV